METKQVIVIRKDLNMRKGKMVAQGCHASLKVFFDLMCQTSNGMIIYDVDITKAMAAWMEGSFAKICVGVNSEQELIEVYNKAKALGIPCSIITDAGRTEFGGVPTKTAVAVGPDEVNKVDKVTGDLALL